MIEPTCCVSETIFNPYRNTHTRVAPALGKNTPVLHTPEGTGVAVGEITRYGTLNTCVITVISVIVFSLTFHKLSLVCCMDSPHVDVIFLVSFQCSDWILCTDFKNFCWIYLWNNFRAC